MGDGGDRKLDSTKQSVYRFGMLWQQHIFRNFSLNVTSQNERLFLSFSEICITFSKLHFFLKAEGDRERGRGPQILHLLDHSQMATATKTGTECARSQELHPDLPCMWQRSSTWAIVCVFPCWINRSLNREQNRRKADVASSGFPHCATRVAPGL